MAGGVTRLFAGFFSKKGLDHRLVGEIVFLILLLLLWIMLLLFFFTALSLLLLLSLLVSPVLEPPDPDLLSLLQQLVLLVLELLLHRRQLQDQRLQVDQSLVEPQAGPRSEVRVVEPEQLVELQAGQVLVEQNVLAGVEGHARVELDALGEGELL